MLNRDPGSGALHVGLFSPALPSRGLSNGIVTYVRIMRDALRSLGHMVTIVDSEQIEFSDGTIADLPKITGLKCRLQMLSEARHGDFSTAYVRLRIIEGFQALKAAGAEVVEIEETWGWAARLVGRGVPVVMRLHGPHALGRETAKKERRDDRREAAELSSFERVQAVTCPSARLLQTMAQIGGRSTLARVIHNPVSVPAEQWSIDRADPNQMLCVGRFDLRKGADIVITAFVRAVENCPRLKLVMVGPDNGLGGTVRFEHFVRCIPLQARAKIEFLGEQTPESIAKLRLTSAFAIVGSRFENFPYAAFEAQALGMPLLSTDVFGLGEMISDGIDGKLVPIADADAMANAILEMAGDPAATARMGAAGRAMVANKMDPRHIARQTVELYQEAQQVFLQPEFHGRT